ncbi:GtrA family protein [Cupriavidus basilensis]|uniref:GtrA family protein n=1 Tax=Cupriavidus basilensis TaxID=68895 RepID=UPI0023E7B902|nr:GtrA family protein [Cupriavidus basilensis]MDF3886535.1 GtrA family protein [Cupriavidus basilensis]
MIRRELGIFLIVGLFTVLLDFSSYRTLAWLHALNVDIAKATSFLIGTVFAYFANRIWTFGQRAHAAGSFIRFSLLYTATLGANVFVNKMMLKIMANSVGAVQVAFLAATAVSAALNFIGMKYFVFQTKPEVEAA